MSFVLFLVPMCLGGDKKKGNNWICNECVQSNNLPGSQQGLISHLALETF